jgi:hypothetical protein
MKNKVRKDGNYELFITTNKHSILAFDNKDWYAIVKGQQGDMLVGSDSNHEKSKTEAHGKYVLVEFEDDPEFKDMPHLFLQQGDKYEEWILPRVLPTQKGDKVKVVKTKEKIDALKIEEHIKNKSIKTSENSENEYDTLKNKSRKNLKEMAKRKDIKGRSKMRREELVKALS